MFIALMARNGVNVNEIAKERCTTLLGLAKEIVSKDKELATRYVILARAIAMRHRLKLGRKDFCKKCNAVFVSGVTLLTRIDAKLKVKTLICKNCGLKLRVKLKDKPKKA